MELSLVAAFAWNDLLTGGFGAFAGAVCAFYFERHKARKDGDTANRAAFIKAQLVLFWHINSLREINRTIVVDIKQHGSRRLNEHPYAGNQDRIDVASVAFLVETEALDLVQDLYIAQEIYSVVVSTIEERNQLVRTLRNECRAIAEDDHSAPFGVPRDSLDLKLFESVSAQLCNVAKSGLEDLEKLQARMSFESNKLWPKLRAFKSIARPVENVRRALDTE